MRKWLIVLSLVFALGIAFYVKESYFNKQHAQIVLAKEINKAMNAMMSDLREARSSTLQEVPADGQWHYSIAFDKPSVGLVRYDVLPDTHELRQTIAGSSQIIARHISGLNIRRQPKTLDILEVQISAHNNSSLVSNFKIRTRD